MKNQLPPQTPPYTGGETDARRRHDITVPHVLPLCKGELERVVGSVRPVWPESKI